MRKRVVVAAGLGVVLLLVAGGGLAVWRLVDGIRNATQAPLPEQADAVMVFAGEERRFELGRQLVEEGRAPVLVLSAGRLPEVARDWCDEQPATFAVVCVAPAPVSTSGEATAFAQLARDRGWASLIGVTGDYHAQRADMLLSRCFEGEVAWGLVAWPSPPWDLTASETLKTMVDWAGSRSC